MPSPLHIDLTIRFTGENISSLEENISSIKGELSKIRKLPFLFLSLVGDKKGGWELKETKLRIMWDYDTIVEVPYGDWIIVISDSQEKWNIISCRCKFPPFRMDKL